jgi:hypothetical protein
VAQRAAARRATGSCRQQANRTLIPLPPCSPELNGGENLWRYLRSHCWSNRAYRDDDELFVVAETSWCQHGLDTDLIKSVCVVCFVCANNDIPTHCILAIRIKSPVRCTTV